MAPSKVIEFKELAEFKFEERPKSFQPLAPPPPPPQKSPPKVEKTKQVPISPKVESTLKTEIAEPTLPVKQAAPQVEEARKSESQEVVKPVAVKSEPPLPKRIMLNNDSETSEVKGAWGQYGRELAAEASRIRQYPAQAIASHLQGSVVVSIRINAQGGSEVRIGQSSGYESIDKEALRMIDQAIKSVALPDMLRGKAKELYIPIGFKL